MREDGYQAKTACGKLQLCEGIKAGIEGVTHSMGQMILERARARRSEEEERQIYEEESAKGGAGEERLRIETEGTEEEAAECLEAALEMEVKGDRGSKGDEEGGGTQSALGALEFLTQEAEPSGTTLVDA